MGLVSCDKEHFSSDPRVLPSFSVDTLSFDTVFTTIGSATLSFKIYNRNNDFIRISNIQLANDKRSHFQLNVDGIPGTQFSNVELRPKDSIYVFCQVRINPADPLSISPFIVLDSIIFTTNGVEQTIYLDARGQNANYFPSKANKGQIAIIDLQNKVLQWNDPKPYIVYGIVYFDHGTLEIAEGTQVHFFGGITKAKDEKGETFFYNDGRMIIGSDAHLKIMGSITKPVIFQGVRLESNYSELAGQWSGIFLDKNSVENEFNNVRIKNNLIGLFLDSLAECKINNSIFSNNTYNGISAYSSKLEVNNSLFYNQGQASVSMQCGGDYSFAYCTMANFNNDDVACFLSNNFCKDPPFCLNFTKNKLIASFANCIFTGSSEDEFYIRKDEDNSLGFQLNLDHCLFRVKDLIRKDQYPDFITDFTSQSYLRNSLDSLFKDISKNNFHPDSLSFLEKKAKPIGALNFDLDGNLRDPINPDLGCYEFQY